MIMEKNYTVFVHILGMCWTVIEDSRMGRRKKKEWKSKMFIKRLREPFGLVVSKEFFRQNTHRFPHACAWKGSLLLRLPLRFLCICFDLFSKLNLQVRFNFATLLIVRGNIYNELRLVLKMDKIKCQKKKLKKEKSE